MLTRLRTSRSTGPAGAGPGKTAAPSAAVAVVPAPIPVEKPAADGEQKAYEQSLLAYKNGERNDPTMNPMVMSLGDADIENLAAYYAQLGCK